MQPYQDKYMLFSGLAIMCLFLFQTCRFACIFLLTFHAYFDGGSGDSDDEAGKKAVVSDSWLECSEKFSAGVLP